MCMLYYKQQDAGPSLLNGPSSMWHHTLKIPDRSAFSGSVQKAIDTGVVSAKARREINQTLHTLALQHTR